MKRLATLLAAAIVAFIVLPGCRSGPEMAKEEYVSKSEMTSIASKAFNEKRDWTALTTAEKRPFLAFYKEESKAKAGFDGIVSGLKYFAGDGVQAGPSGPK